MKATTTTVYETADGRTFTDPVKARTHEIEKWLKEANNDEQKLTVPRLISLVASDTDGFMALLETFYATAEEAVAAE